MRINKPEMILGHMTGRKIERSTVLEFCRISPIKKIAFRPPIL